MNYNKLYSRFIESRPVRKKVSGNGLERHHILPKCLGGKNTVDNIVVLTPREHFIAHRLLHKFTTGMARSKMAYALQRMTCNKRQLINSRTHARVTEIYREEIKQQSLKLWQDPEYIAKQKTYRSSEERRAISRQSMLINRSKMRQLPKRGKVDPAQRLAQLYIKYGTHPTRSQQYYLRQIKKQLYQLA